VSHRARSLPTVVWVAGGLLLAAVVGLAILVAVGVPLAEEKRTLAADPNARHELVHEVLLLGVLKVRVHALVFNKFDALTGFALSAVAVAAVMVAVFIRTVGGVDRRALFRFWLLVAAGAAFLAFDELASVHESAGFTYELWVGQIPGFDYEGDLIFALYLIPAVGFLILERRQIARSRLCVRLLSVAAALAVLVAVFDSAVSSSHMDEMLELVVAGLLVVAFGRLAVTHVAGELRSVGVVPRPLLGGRPSGATMPRFDPVSVPGEGVTPST
jgi:hypothetical protein